MNKVLTVVKDVSPSSEEIVKIAAKICKAENSKLYIAYVFEVPMSLPLEEEVPEELERGDAILDWASARAEELGVPAETHIIQARSAGAGILDEVNDLKVDLLVMGMKKEPLPGMVTVGTTAEYVIKAASCRILLVRSSLKALKNNTLK